MANGATATAQHAAQAVALDGVSVAFRLAGGGSYTAVERASLRVADGEFVAIVGPTGCGKSTLLNIAAGLMPPSSGTVDIFARPAICFRPMRCFPGRPRWRTSPSGWRLPARRQARPVGGRRTGSRVWAW